MINSKNSLGVIYGLLYSFNYIATAFPFLSSNHKKYMLSLTRPIAFIDLETTGVNLSSDRIVEIAIIKLMPDNTRQVKRKIINPEMPIPKQSSDIHGITDEMVKDAPTFKQAGNEIKQFLDNCDLGGYNSNRFDIPILMEEFLRAGMDVDLSNRKMIDVQHIFYSMEPRTLTAAYKFYCQKDLENAHNAEADITATIDVLMSQMNRYQNLGNFWWSTWRIKYQLPNLGSSIEWCSNIFSSINCWANSYVIIC